MRTNCLAPLLFLLASSLSAEPWTKHVVAEKTPGANSINASDFDGDGHIDLISSHNGQVVAYRGPDFKPFSVHRFLPLKPGQNVRGGCIHACLLDVDNDGDMDFCGSNKTVFWLECPDKPFDGTPWTYRNIDSEIKGTHCLITGDVDRDGRLDLIANSFATADKTKIPESITWQKIPADPKTAANWERHVFAKGDAPGGNHYMGFGDVNKDGRPDIACGAKGGPKFPGGEWFAWWEQGEDPTKPWKKHMLSATEVGATCIIPVDLDADGHMDYVASRGHGKGVLQFKGPDFKKIDIDPTIDRPHCLAVADIDADGDTDFATCGSLKDGVAAWYENRNGAFTKHVIGTDTSSYDIRLIDLDNDKDLDVLIAGHADANIVWFEQPGSGGVGQKLEKVAEGFGLCDGPAYDGSQLFIPDVKTQELHRYQPRTGKKDVVLKPGSGRFSATFFAHGKLYLSDVANNRIAVIKPGQPGKAETWFEMPEQKPPLRSNDLVVDHHGGVYFTATRQGQVWYVSAAGEARVVVDDIKTPNGIILSPDGGTLYVSAYVPKEIWKYKVQPAEAATTWQGERFAAMDDGEAKGADGMTIDRAGNVYCAGATDVWVWSPSGQLIEKIRTPSRPINAAFAGPDPQLYITCMAKAATEGHEAIPSAVYRVPRDINGVAAHPPQTPEDQSANKIRPSTAINDHVTFHHNIVYHTEGDRKLLVDICQPHAKSSMPCLVIVHGGGWLKGDKTKFRALANKLAAKGYVTAAVEYRLGGEAPFPAGVRDCNNAVKFLKANAATYKIRPGKIGVVGGSAGGHIAGLMASGWKLEALDGEQIHAAVVMAGPLEISRGQVAERSRSSAKSNALRWMRGTIDQQPERYQLACAWSHIDADSAPILFMAGEHDYPERNQASRDKLKAAGVWTGLKVYQDGKHGCWNLSAWIDPMVDDIDAFFREQFR